MTIPNLLPPIMPPPIRRLHILGGPGSGKSTLARQLGQTLALPVYELDTIAFEGRDFRTRPLGLRLAEIHQIADSPRWLTEGIFLEWVDELLQTADLIIWLDHIPWHVAARRLVGRFSAHGWHTAQRQSGHQKFTRVGDYRRALTQLAQALISTHAYYTQPLTPVSGDIRHVTRAQTAQDLRHMPNVVHCQDACTLPILISELRALQMVQGSSNANYVSRHNTYSRA